MVRMPRVAILAVLAALIGCGSAPSVTPPVVSTPTPHAPATPTPTAVPTPQPLPPLALLRSDTEVSAVDASGHAQWSLTTAQVNTLLGAVGQDRTSIRVAGPNVLLSVVTTGPSPVGRVVVLDGTGVSLGGGSFTPNNLADDVFGAPTGSEWAYSVDDSPSSAGRHHGRIVVAGIGVAPHTVFTWVAPPGDNEQVSSWTDMGIVMERVSLGGCGAGFHPDSASFLVNPRSGTLRDLFSADHYGDARHGVQAAFAAHSPSMVIINGARFDEAGTVADRVFVSPGGTTVGVGRFSVAVCAGTTTVTVSTELVNVATGDHTDVRGCELSGWFDAARFVCGALDDPTQHLESVSGEVGAVLGNGQFLGALSGG
jgi:hypothetical protein